MVTWSVKLAQENWCLATLDVFDDGLLGLEITLANVSLSSTYHLTRALEVVLGVSIVWIQGTRQARHNHFVALRNLKVEHS